jgi:hypothetical protein
LNTIFSLRLLMATTINGLLPRSKHLIQRGIKQFVKEELKHEFENTFGPSNDKHKTIFSLVNDALKSRRNSRPVPTPHALIERLQSSKQPNSFPNSKISSLISKPMQWRGKQYGGNKKSKKRRRNKTSKKRHTRRRV